MSEPVEPDPARLRSLHDRGLTPDQIRRLTPEQITSSRYFPARTILTWLPAEATDAATAALPQQASMSPSNTSPRAVVPGDGIPPEEDHRALHAKVALLEAQLRRRSFEQASRTPSPARSARISPECAHPGPGFMERQDRETIDHLKQVNGAGSQPQDPPGSDLLPGALAGTRLGGRLVGAGGASRALPGARRRV